MILYAVPIAAPQLWLFYAFALAFLGFVILAAGRRRRETGGQTDSTARKGILIQTVGIFLAGVGPLHPRLAWSSAGGIAGVAAVLLLMGAAVGLFATSSATLGKNWSIEARTLEDHQLICTGPYAMVRHPIYLAMLLFLLGLAAAMGHWLQLFVAVPVYLAGTKMRTKAEERLLEQSFGDRFRDYRTSTPAIIPKIV